MFPRGTLLIITLAALIVTSASRSVPTDRLSRDKSASAYGSFISDQDEFIASHEGGQRRKTLAFGHELPHAKFITDPKAINAIMPASMAPLDSYSDDPLLIATYFARALALQSFGGVADDDVEVLLRQDSYTDPITGLTHAFFRQRIVGREVVDAHLAVNVHQGQVVSFSDSFFRTPPLGSTFVPMSEIEVKTPWEYHCPSLHETIYPSHLQSSAHLPSDQTILGLSGKSSLLADPRLNEREIQRLQHLYDSNCLSHSIPTQDLDGDNPALAAALHLLATVTPDTRLRHILHTPNVVSFTQQLGTYSTYEDEDLVHMQHERLEQVLNPSSPGFHGKGGMTRRVEVLHNLPGTQSPVRAYPAWIQFPVPNSDEIKLVPVYHITMELSHNWYEATVGFQNIWSIVDWANDLWEEGVVFYDQSMFVPSDSGVTEHLASQTSEKGKGKKDEEVKPATYRVYAFGLNDPSVPITLNLTSNDTSDGRTSELEEKSADSLASPLGWHGVPQDVTYPYPIGGEGHRVKDKDGQKKADSVNYTVTAGNNGICHENWDGRSDWIENYRPDSGISRNFSFSYDPKSPPREPGGDDLEATEPSSNPEIEAAKQYINATVTQLFYTVNMVHDLYYRYGFTEPTGNFQQHNFERGGLGTDSVITNAQDGSGLNNANFMTPPDGQHGRCRMYLWSTARPYRDGDMEAGIVIHELSHGLSIRLTGGPANSGCMGWGESGGMGEGWGDFLATVIRTGREGKEGDYAMGAWAANRERGIRNYIYSVNNTVNPSTYKTLDKPGYWGVHAIGEVWAEMMFIVNDRLVKKHGFGESLFPPPVEADESEQSTFWRKPVNDATIRSVLQAQTERLKGDKKHKDPSAPPPPLVPIHGNALSVLLSLTAMKLQPCNPSFFDARDALIQADRLLTGGENMCEIWEEFARRGLGVDASVVGKTPWGGGVRRDGFAVPVGCETSK